MSNMMTTYRDGDNGTVSITKAVISNWKSNQITPGEKEKQRFIICLNFIFIIL